EIVQFQAIGRDLAGRLAIHRHLAVGAVAIQPEIAAQVADSNGVSIRSSDLSGYGRQATRRRLDPDAGLSVRALHDEVMPAERQIGNRKLAVAQLTGGLAVERYCARGEVRRDLHLRTQRLKNQSDGPGIRPFDRDLLHDGFIAVQPGFECVDAWFELEFTGGRSSAYLRPSLNGSACWRSRNP